MPFAVARLTLPRTATVRQAMELMAGPAAVGMVLVAGKTGRLEGVVVDSDLRKGMLKGHGLDAPLSAVMNPKPVTLPRGATREEISRFMRRERRANVPIVDKKGRVVDLVRLSEHLADAEEKPNWVVLMVGGAGRRLLPLTQDRPKPLLPVGPKPLLETIIEQFEASGFKRFFLATNHQAEQIVGHFGDGSRLGVEIRYLRERESLGTAGALSLLPSKPDHPLIVMNGDLLTKVDFPALVRYHEEEGHDATVCVREYDFQVPFGVVQMDAAQRLERILEKPTHRFFVNAGIYVLSPGVLRLVPKGRLCDMTSILEKARGRGAVGCFPVREYWIDIGQPDDYQRARREYPQVFE